MIKVSSVGDFKRTEKFLNTMRSGSIFRNLERFGRMGVDALSSATPVDTGRAAHSWTYQVGVSGSVYSISWLNTDVEGGLNVIILLQYGHGTGTGGYVQGRDFINPAMRPVFDKIAEGVWREVLNA
jgi:hypothetical protein